ncbi:GGDEF domain-containing protein, partial [candidate division KSB1 bacterium]|nr:GGDEF domain-containing protein [candidate division KSB1 bacterium]
EPERTIGLIVLIRQDNNAFDSAEISQLEQISVHVAAVIDKTILYHTTKELAFTDGLTGIFNRRYFDQRYLREILRARRYKRSLSILMIDIDHFKIYNDTFGHLMGDEVLKKVSQELEMNIRRADILCRFGGEEFVIILPEIDIKHAAMVAEKLRTAVSHTGIRGEENMPNKNVTISIGVAAFPENGEDGIKLLEKADQALYQAKKNGRNRIETASS